MTFVIRRGMGGRDEDSTPSVVEMGIHNLGSAGRTLAPLFLVGCEGNPVYVLVATEYVRIFVGGFDEGCASCSVAHF